MNISFYFQIGIEALWTLYLLANWAVSNNSFCKKNIALNYKLISIPILVMAAYAMIIWAFNSDIQLRNYTRLISTCLQLLFAWGFGASGYYLFKDKVIDYIFIAGILSYVLGSIVCFIWRFGFNDFAIYIWNLILGIENTELAEYIMEVHDLTFAMGLFFLFYTFCDKRKKKYGKIILSILLILFGLKRIEILALTAAIVIYYLLLKWGKTIHYRATFIAICFLILCLGYVYIIKSGILEEICNALSINTMGRINYYSFSSNYFRFSPWYMGTGFTAFKRMWGELHNSGFRLNGHVIAATLHSDILIFYIENGFILTVGWIFYSFNVKVKSLKNHFGSKIAECYLLITTYMFILYLTDNTFSYAGTQMVYFVIPLCQYYLIPQKEKIRRVPV